MPPAAEGWDFTAVLDLMKRLSTQDTLSSPSPSQPSKEEPLPDLTQTDSAASSEVETSFSALGNFDSVWTNLTPDHKPKTKVTDTTTPTAPIEVPAIKIGKGDVSDDNLVDDELDFDLANSFAERDLEEPGFTPSKASAKRTRRKAAAAARKLSNDPPQKPTGLITHPTVSTSLPNPKILVEPAKVQTPTKPSKAKPQPKQERRPSSEAITKFDDSKKSKKTREVVSDNDYDVKKIDQKSKDRQKIIKDLTTPSPAPATKKSVLPSAIRYETTLTPSSIVSPSKPKDVRFVDPEPRTPLTPVSTSTLNTNTNTDTTYTFSARKAHLTALLYSHFRNEWASLENLASIRTLPSHQALDPTGIHVFIDISNILIGFHETIKESQGLHKHSRMPRQKLAFHNFSLILERGRPVAKRVLAGSDRWESILEAAEIGYKTLILERVEKVREPSERQKRLAAKRSTSSPYSGTGFTDSSDGEGRSLRPRRVEQAVDEILHLNMLETIVDAETPSTIVLATGDAAEAEYSGGFMAMVERALLKGWKVEVIAWRAGMSWRYRDPAFQSLWKDQFKVVELDGFVSALMGDYV